MQIVESETALSDTQPRLSAVTRRATMSHVVFVLSTTLSRRELP